MISFSRLILCGLLTTMLAASTALAQVQQPPISGYGGYDGFAGHPGMGAGAGYYGGYGAAHGGSATKLPRLGAMGFTFTGAVEGLGFQGSYLSAQSTIPIGGIDPLHGWWLIDGRVNISERGLPFTNLGLVRRTHFRPMNADFGVGVYYDMDADQWESFGHTFQQIGVSANMWTPRFDININGYVPVGDVNHSLGYHDYCFYQNFLVLQNGIDAALEGFDINFVFRPDWWAQKSGSFNVGLYAYRQDGQPFFGFRDDEYLTFPDGSSPTNTPESVARTDVDPFVGFRGGLSFQPKPGMVVSFGLTADDEFDPSGVFQLEIVRGRSRGLSPSGRDLDPMVRMAHIVRLHQDPILGTDPETGELYHIVHVNNAAPDGGNGTFERPFNELSDADGTLPPLIVEFPRDSGRVLSLEIPRSSPNDIIFVNEGLSRFDPGVLTPLDPNDGTPLDPTDDLPGDLTGYDTGIALLDGQMLLGDGVQHVIPTVERGNFVLCNNIDGLTPFISNAIHFPTPTSGTQPNRAAITLADDTTVRGFNIINSEIGILAPDPTPNFNNNDGITGDIVLERTNIFINNQFDENDLVRNTGDVVDPDLARIQVPLKYGISILDSTADFAINNVNIKGMDVILPADIFDDGAGGTRVINFSTQGNLVAELNIERGAPDIVFNGTINNEFRLLQEVVVDDGDPLTIDPVLLVEFDTLAAGGRAVRIVDTTGGNIFIDGLINNVMGQGIMINNADDTTITIDSMVMISQSLNEAISVFNSDNSVIAFTNQELITDPLVAGVHLADNNDTFFTFFDLQVTTPANQAALDAGLPLPNTPVTGFLAQRNADGMITVTGKSLLDIVGGPALSVASPDTFETPVDMTFTRLRSVNSADGGVLLSNISGEVRSTRTTVIDSIGTGISVRSNDGDPLLIDFGQTTVMDSGALVQGPGVRLENNPSATISFDQLSVTTANGTAFTAVGGGTIHFNSLPTLNASNGAALNLEGITGMFQNAPGLVFGDLISGDPADPTLGSPNFGVRIVDVVNDVEVIGRTSIDSSAAAGVFLAGGVDDITFGEIDITNRENVGIQINGVGGDVVIASADIDNTNNIAGNAINIRNTTVAGGSVTINDGTITDPLNDGINIRDSNVTIANVNISAPNAASMHNGINVISTDALVDVVNLFDNTIATINGSGIDARAAAGGLLELAVDGNTTSSINGSGIIIDGTAGGPGALIVTSVADNTVLQGAAGTGAGGILIREVTFDADTATAGLQAVDGGDTIIGTSAARITGDGLTLLDVEGTLAFKQLDIFNDTGTGLLVKNPDTDFTLVTGGGNINTTNGAAMDIDPTTLDMNLNSVTSTNAANTSSGPAINLDDVRGELFIDRTTITDAGTAIKVSNSFNGLAVNFGDTNITGTGMQGDGVVLDNNATALIEFQGLNVLTDNGNGFFVRDGGTVNFRGAAPNITANNGTAVDIDELTIGQTGGVDGWRFNTINLNTVAGATGGSAIRLNNIQNDFRVIGNVNINSNGEAGIFINGGSSDIRFGQVNSINRLAVGIQVQDFNGTARFASTNIDNANMVAGNAINIIDTYANGNMGNVAILGGLITDAENDAVHIENSIATIASVSIRTPNAADAHDGISVITDGINDAIVLLDSNSIIHPDGVSTGDVGVRLLSNGTGTLFATISDNLLDPNDNNDPLVDSIASIHATVASGRILMNAYENHDGDGTSPTNPIRLENLGGVLDVTQTSAGNLSLLNNNVNIIETGVITYGAGNPPEPPAIPSN